jgi:hypothetical protein
LDLSGLKLKRDTFFQQIGLPSSVAANASREERMKFDLMSNVASSLEKLPLVSIQARVGGTFDDPSINIDSNLDNEFARIIKNSVGDVVASQRKELEDQLQNQVKEQTAGVESKLAAVQAKLNGQLGQYEQKVQQKIQDAAGINLGGGEGSSGGKIPSLNKLFKK